MDIVQKVVKDKPFPHTILISMKSYLLNDWLHICFEAREGQNTYEASLNQHVFTISDQTYKIMIVNGLTTSRGVEIVALNSNSTSNCFLELPEFPTAVAGTVGGLIDATIPMVCGGRDPPTKLCYLYQGQSRSWMTGNFN